MKIFDSHVHVGDANLSKSIIENSIYKNKYRLYSSVDYKVMDQIDDYLSNVDAYFAMPIIFKEISIPVENNFLKDYCKNHPGAVEVPLIDPSVCYNNLEHYIYKEHFLLHDYNLFEERLNHYTHLNQNRGFLILHCKDRIRIDYVKKINNFFPNINIIVAHLGRNATEDCTFCKEVIDCFCSYDNIFFDISTVKNIELISYAVYKCGSSRILFGTDFPYEKQYDQKIDEYIDMIMKLNISLTEKENVLYNNANDIRRYIKTKN